MRLITLALGCGLLMSLNLYAAGCASLLVVDSDPKTVLPKRFRIINSNGMKAIGSGQFSKAQLIHIKNQINAPIIIVDLRQEAHGFADGLPISWYGVKNWENLHRSNHEIEIIQDHLLKNLTENELNTVHYIVKKDKMGRIIESRTDPLTINSAYTEEMLAKQLGMGYQRFYIPDHMPPDKEQIRSFNHFLRTVPKNNWLYFHCRGGAGRTTTFLMLYDLFLNKNHVELEEIIKRQIEFGGKDLTKLPPQTSYKYHYAKKRLDEVVRQAKK